MLDNIKWLGHSAFLIEGPPVIFIDPWRVVRQPFNADVILVSHTHYDHCSPADIDKLRGPETQIIGNEDVADRIEGTTVLRPWHTLNIDRLSIKAVPAYHPDSIQHPKSAGGMGFVLSINYYDIYYAGDTGLIPEMKHVHPDIAILPINGSDTLSVDDAIEAVNILKPRYTLPCKWGSPDETVSIVEARRFKKQVADITDVILLEKDT
jgi:L-ascorbate metabolism protein UlaG (beta-lactamase superfamily)